MKKDKNQEIVLGEKIKEIKINREIFVKKQILLYAVLLIALSSITISVMVIWNSFLMIAIGIVIIIFFTVLCMLSIYKFTRKISYTLYSNAIVTEIDTMVEKIPLLYLVDAKIYSSFLSKVLNYNTKRIVLYFNDKSQSKKTLYSITEDAEALVEQIKNLANNLKKSEEINKNN